MSKFIVENFYERYIQVLTDVMLYSTNEEGVLQGNLTYQGYLVKFDPDYLYLGTENNEIMQAVDREHIVSITDVLLYAQDEENKAGMLIDNEEMH